MKTLPIKGKIDLTYTDVDNNERGRSWRFPKQGPEHYKNLDDYIYQVLVGIISIVVKFVQDVEGVSDARKAKLFYRISNTIYKVACEIEIDNAKGLTK
jgi:hypothetical protein